MSADKPIPRTFFVFRKFSGRLEKTLKPAEKTRINILDEITNALPDFNSVFHPVSNGFDVEGPVDFELETGQAEFVKKQIPIVSSGEIPISSGKKDIYPAENKFYPSNFGYLRIPYKNNVIAVINVHGLTFRPDDKLDTPERLEQSRLIKEFATKENGPVIICGDFNVFPQTQSIIMFEDKFVNLIKKYGVSTTRSKISPWHGTPRELKFSDYTFVSPEIEVLGFSAPDIEISDHLPLVIEFR